MKNKIKYYRELKNLSQAELGENINSTQTRISQLEMGLIHATQSEIILVLKVLGCSFEDLFCEEIENEKLDTCHALIKYTFDAERKHVDPNFNYLVYGESKKNKISFLKNNIKEGSYVFFHTNICGSDFITAYYYVDKILDGKNESNKAEILKLNCDASEDEVVIIGNIKKSKILNSPLLLDKKLAISLHSLNIQEEDFKSDKTELQTIGNKTRPHRKLSVSDVNLLKKLCKNRG